MRYFLAVLATGVIIALIVIGVIVLSGGRGA